MEWSKLKNIIILILLLANLFLLVMVGAQEHSTVRTQEKAITDALAVLEHNGILLHREVIPDRIVLPPMSVTRDQESEAALAEELLGSCAVSHLGGGRFLYESELGQAEFRSNGNFSFLFFKGEHVAEHGNPDAHAVSTMARIGFSGAPVSREEDGTQVTVTLCQSHLEIPVFSCQVSLQYRENALRSITGQRLMGSPSADSDNTSITVPTALLRILNGITDLGDICSEITEITPGYLLSSADSLRMIPVWQVTTDTGIYTLNTLTGALDRA